MKFKVTLALCFLSLASAVNADIMGSGKITIAPGTYYLDAPIVLDAGQVLDLTGATLYANTDEAAIEINGDGVRIIGGLITREDDGPDDTNTAEVGIELNGWNQISIADTYIKNHYSGLHTKATGSRVSSNPQIHDLSLDRVIIENVERACVDLPQTSARVSSLNFTNCKFQLSKNHGLYIASNNVASTAMEIDRLTIDNCSFTKIIGNALYLDGNRFRVVGNTIESTVATPINVAAGSDDLQFINNTINKVGLDNTAHPTTWEVELDTSPYSSIEAMTFASGCDNIMIMNNSISNIGGDAVGINGTSGSLNHNISIVGNHIADLGKTGSSYFESFGGSYVQQLLIQNNNLYTAAYTHVDFSNSADAIVTGNIYDDSNLSSFIYYAISNSVVTNNLSY